MQSPVALLNTKRPSSSSCRGCIGWRHNTSSGSADEASSDPAASASLFGPSAGAASSGPVEGVSSSGPSAEADSCSSPEESSSGSAESLLPLSVAASALSSCLDPPRRSPSSSAGPRMSSARCSCPRAVGSPSAPGSGPLMARSAALCFALMAFFCAEVRLRSSSSASCFSKLSASSWHSSSSASRSNSVPLATRSCFMTGSAAAGGTRHATRGGSETCVTTLRICSRWRSMTLRRRRSRTLPGPSWPDRPAFRDCGIEEVLGESGASHTAPAVPAPALESGCCQAGDGSGAAVVARAASV